MRISIKAFILYLIVYLLVLVGGAPSSISSGIDYKSLNNIDNNFCYTIIFSTSVAQCFNCNLGLMNSIIHDFKAKFPNSNIIVSVSMDDVRDLHPALIKRFKEGLIIPDVGGNLNKFLGIDKNPGLCVINHYGDILFKVDNLKDTSKLKSVFQGLTKPITYVQKKGLLLDQNAENEIGRPGDSPFLSFKDNTLKLVDHLKNSISSYSLIDGKLITEIYPIDSLKLCFLGHSINQKLIDLQDRVVFAEYKSIVPNIQTDSMYLLTKVLEAIIINKDNVNISSLIMRDVIAQYHNDKLISIDSLLPEEYSFSHVKKSNDIYFANTFYVKRIDMDIIKNDTIYTFAISDNPNLRNYQFKLPYNQLLEKYKFESFNFYTVGLIEYIAKNNSFLYVNPWNNIFLLLDSNDNIKKLEPKGILNQCFESHSNFFDSFTENYKEPQNQFFLNAAESIGDRIYILIKPYIENSYSNYYIIQVYSINGKFIKEQIFDYQNDKIYRIWFVENDENKLFVLIKTKSRRWELKEILLDIF